MRHVVWMLIVAMCVAGTVLGQEKSDGLAITGLGSDDLLSLRVGVRPWQGRTEIGGYGIWLDGLKEGEDEAYGGGIYGTYDVVQDANFTLLNVQVPIVWYAGGQIGFLHREDSDEDAGASLMTGLSFGDEKVRIGVEYQYMLDQDLWKEFGAIDDRGRLLLRLSYQF